MESPISNDIIFTLHAIGECEESLLKSKSSSNSLNKDEDDTDSLDDLFHEMIMEEFNDFIKCINSVNLTVTNIKIQKEKKECDIVCYTNEFIITTDTQKRIKFTKKEFSNFLEYFNLITCLFRKMKICTNEKIQKTLFKKFFPETFFEQIQSLTNEELSEFNNYADYIENFFNVIKNCDDQKIIDALKIFF